MMLIFSAEQKPGCTKMNMSYVLIKSLLQVKLILIDLETVVEEMAWQLFLTAN